MKILLTNDDGIRAPGISALFDAICDTIPGAEGMLGGALGKDDLEIMVVAPATVQSATSHGITFDEPLTVSPARVNERMAGIAVDGRPADCVKLAIAELWPERFGAGSKPDLVISGMNAGANCGINVIYSGTVAAALEAAFLGIPSIAVSLYLGGGRAMFDVAAAHGRRAIDRVLAADLLEPGGCVSLNVPRTPEPDDEVAASREAERMAVGTHSRMLAGPRPDLVKTAAEPNAVVCGMNTHGLVDAYEKRTSPSGETYYWAAGGGVDFRGTDPGTDVQHLLAGDLTITPLSHDLTDPSLDAWSSALGGGSR